MHLLAMGILIFLLSGHFPQITERVYSSFIYKILGQSLSHITGVFPFSLAEIIIVSLAVFVIAYIIKTLTLNGVKKFFLNIITFVGIIYFSFQLLWGLNYNRPRLQDILALDVSTPADKELIALCESLILEANNLRAALDQSAENVSVLPYKKDHALKIAWKGFENASIDYPILKGRYGKPKGIILSRLMCYTGISGFYFPFTAEANVNLNIPDPFLPFTIAHEMAHQRGIAREDEANFIAYIVCTNHPDMYFQYSGILSALNYAMSALGKSNNEKYSELLTTYSSGVMEDIRFNNTFWSKYSGPVERASNKINDTYLKAQNQKTGVKSYGAMVDLLIGKYRKDQYEKVVPSYLN